MTRPVRQVSTPFLRLRSPADWANAVRNEQVFFDDAAGGIRLGDENATAISPTEPGGTFGGLTRPTGLAAGPDGRLFMADPNGNRLLTYTTHTGAFVPLWPARTVTPPDAYTLSEPRGLAFSRDGDLAVADTGHGRVIVYTWPGLAVRHILDLPGGRPWDLAYDRRGYLFVADVGGKVVRCFDRLWRPVTSYAGGDGLLANPQHLAFDERDRLLVLDSGLRAIVELDGRGHAIASHSASPVLDGQGQPLPPLAPKLHARRFPPPLRLDERGLWLLQDDHADCPALLLTGLQVDRRGRLADAGVMLLARPLTVRYPRTGRLITAAYDSGIFDCVWHRLVFDVDAPAATSLTVRTLTAPAAWEATRVQALPDSLWSRPLTIGPEDGPEVLVQSGPGRFLWIECRFDGNGAATPLLRGVDVHAPRASSLSFLPPVFHQDPVSASFLDRLLSYFDTVFAEIESQIEHFTGYLDPDGVPSGDFLTWLGGWLDVEFLAEWPDAVRREFIRRAIGLYKQRGTVGGMQAILRLHAGLQAPLPVIIEHFRLRRYTAQRQAGVADLVAGQLYLAGAPLAPAAGATAHQFTVVVPSQAAGDDAAVTTLHRLIAAQKPAHTGYELRIVTPGVRIGCQSTVGVDMLVGGYPAAPVGQMLLAVDSQLASPAPPYPRVGSARIA